MIGKWRVGRFNFVVGFNFHLMSSLLFWVKFSQVGTFQSPFPHVDVGAWVMPTFPLFLIYDY
jgi:hypothetical protein